MKNIWKKYILWFAQEHVDFRLAEFNSIAKLLNLQFRHGNNEFNSMHPFWIVEFPNDETALKFASRSVLLRCVLELWSHANNMTMFHKQLQDYVQHNATLVQPYFAANCSFKVTVETYNKHLSQSEKVQRIEALQSLAVQGKVNLKTPQVEWWYIEFWGLDPTAVPEVPDDVLLGRLLATGQRHLIKELSLKQRKFIGTTSMDAQLSLLMANQALVQNGDLVFDPFVGTGSLLVSAAKFGGYVLGADIDFMMLHARSRPSRITQKVRDKDESIRANLKQYDCAERYVDVLVSDFANSIWRHDVQFDCIITDPPYGIREATEKVEMKDTNKCSMRNVEQPHYPSTSRYNLQQLYADLLNFAARHLKLGGRLVCWLPFHRSDYTADMLPMHASLQLLANSEQHLTGLTARRLLTYEKMSNHLQPTMQEQQIVENDFRQRYFDSGLETRNERRQRKAAARETGRQEALRRGKQISDGKQLKCALNKARFS